MNYNTQMAIKFYKLYIYQFPCAVYHKGEFIWYSTSDDIAQISINKLLWL